MSLYKINNGEISYISPEAIVNRELVIPNEINGQTVMSIGNNVMENRDDVDVVICPNTLVSIGLAAFRNCSIKKIVLPPGLLEIRAVAFENSSLTSISLYGKRFGREIFANCTDLKEVKLNNVKFISQGMFKNSSLSKINLESVERIEGEAFRNTKIKSIIYRNNFKLNSISCEAFRDCKYLEILILPDNMIRIGDEAFRDCIKLTICSFAVKVNDLGTGIFMGCKSLAYMKWKLNYIPEATFCDCKKLNKIDFLEKIQSIGRFAFYNTGFIELEWPDNVEMKEGVLAHCTKITTLYVSEDIKKHPDAHYDCRHLKVVHPILV